MKKLLYTAVILFIAINAKATKHIVTSTNDDAESPTVGMFRYAVENASNGDTIVFNVSTITLDTAIRISGGILTIDGGNGVIIDGNSKDRVFNISCYSSSDNILIRNLTIQNGRVESSTATGGGMYVYILSGNVNVDNCTFKNNTIVSTGDGQGGALRTNGGTFTNCFFLNNQVAGTASALGGGGIYSVGGEFINCVIAGNSAKYGGGVYSSTSSEFINCTITQNSALNSDAGGGLSCEDNCSFTNTILYNNKSNNTENNIYNYLGTSSFSHCAVENANTIVGSSSNVGLTVTPFTHTGQDSLSIFQGSVCENAGTTTGITVLSSDIIGNKRVADSKIDIGAYEFNIPLYDAITVTNNSFDPSVANSLPWAISHADSACVIKFDNNYHIDVTQEIKLTDYITIDGSGYSVELDGNESYRIFNISGSDGDTITLRNLLIQNGYTTGQGGGIYSKSGNNILINIQDCVFENNISDNYGGAIYNYNSGIITNCTFYNNKSILSNSAIFVYDGIFTNCLFYESNLGITDINEGNVTYSYCASTIVIPGENNVLLWANPFVGGNGSDRLFLNSNSYCANVGTPDISSLSLPSVDIAGNQRVLNDTIDIGAYESNYQSITPRELYKNIVVSNNSFNVNVNNSLPWAIAHADDSCTITFNNDYTINVSSEISIGSKSLTIDGGSHSIVLDGGDSTRLFSYIGKTSTEIQFKSLTFQNGNSKDGGALLLGINNGGNVYITNCIFQDNNAENGGAIYIVPIKSEKEGITIVNTAFIRNAASYGGGIYSYNNSYNYDDKGNSFINCTFTKNESNKIGAAIYVYGKNIFVNSLFYDNKAPNGQSIVISNFAGMPFTYCASDNNLSFGYNCVRLYSSPFIGEGLQLKSNSYCSNAGNPSLYGLGLPLVDLAGNTRVLNGRIDIGAYESNFLLTPPRILYDSIVVNNNSFDVFVENSFPWALEYISDGGKIIFNNDFTINVSSEIILGDKNLTIDGGEHRIILDGGDSTRIFILEAVSINIKKVKLKNLTLTRGHADYGGAILLHSNNNNSKIELENCLFYKNSANRGGGVYSKNLSYYFYNCVFIENLASSLGGGAYTNNGGYFINCSFSNNYTDAAGGGLYTYRSNFINSLIYGNKSKNNAPDILTSDANFDYCASGENLSLYGEGNLLLTENPFIGSANLYDSLMLKPGSVLINAGNPDTTGLNLPGIDFKMNSRIASDTVDIGAYEYYDHVISSSTGGNGVILPEIANVINGRNQKMSFIPDIGYVVDSVWVDNLYVDSTGAYTFYNVIADHDVEVTFKIDSFNIYTEIGEHGVIAPCDTIITYFDTVQYIITPDVGYRIDTAVFGNNSIINNLVKVGNTHYFKIDSLLQDDTLHFTFCIDTFNIKTEVSEGGILSPGDTMITYFDTIQYTIIPDIGYKIDTAVFGDNSITDNLIKEDNKYHFTIDSLLDDETLHISFCPDTFNITTIVQGSGNINPMNFTTTYFDTTEIIISPGIGYHINTAEFDGSNIMNQLNEFSNYSVFTIKDILQDDTLEVNFVLDTFHIQTTVEGNGTVTPADTLITYGGNITFSITPNQSYEIETVQYSGQNVYWGLNSQNGYYTYYRGNIFSDGTLSVKFKQSIVENIDKINKDDIVVFPNPTQGKLFIKRPGDLKECKLLLIDMNGKVLLNYPSFNDESIDIQDLPDGNYILQLDYQNQRIGIPVIKK